MSATAPAVKAVKALARPGRVRAAAGLALAWVLACGWGTAQAQAQPEAPVARSALRICQDPQNLPFSNHQAEGFENRIADLLGRALGLPVSYYEFPQRMGFVRNTLRKKLPDADYPCDLILGVPAGYEQVASTRPYYRSSYVLVLRREPRFEGIRDPAQLLALPPEQLARLRIGVFDRSPAAQWLTRHGLLSQGVPYPMLSADPDWYPGQIIDQELAQGRIDAAIVWGPVAGYHAQRVADRVLPPLPLASEPGVRFDYAVAMGVRHGEPAWKQQVQDLIERLAPEIDTVLKAYHVPLLPLSPRPQEGAP